MRKVLLATVVALSFLVGMASTRVITQVDAHQVVIEPGWRFTDGHWNFYDPDDKAWYYTDGANWYMWGDNAWKVYDFKRGFGRKDFYREGYLMPGPDVAIPRHRVYIP